MRRVKVIYMEPNEPLTGWGQAIVEIVGPHHDLAIYDYGRSIPEQLAHREVIIDLGGWNATPQMMEAAPNIKLWQMLTVGYNGVDLRYARSKNIPIAHCPGATSAIGLAETVMTFILMLAKKYDEAQAELRQGRLYGIVPGDVKGQILGVVGFGASGKETARRATAFGMRIMIVEPMPIDRGVLDEVQPIFVGKPDQLDKLVSESDYISLHLPVNEGTRRIIDAERIRLMKPTACLINVARGGLVDEPALHKALLEGRIGGVGVDVFADRILEPSMPLLDHPRFVATPHVSGMSPISFRNRAQFALENTNRVAQGLEPKYRVE